MHGDGAVDEVEGVIVHEDQQRRVRQSDQNKWQGDENGGGDALLVARGYSDTCGGDKPDEANANEANNVQSDADLAGGGRLGWRSIVRTSAA